jgi:hypothetical protein
MPIIFAEDQALKAKFAGMVVPWTPHDLPVTVRFRNPQDDLSTLRFPIIVIEHTNLAIDHEREHRGYTNLDYAPEGKAIWWLPTDATYDPNDSPYFMEFPIPMNLDYEITVLTRETQHMMMLVAMLTAADRLDPRFGFLYIPQDRTTRRLEIIGEAALETDRDSDGKRIVRAKYAIRVPTEIIPTNYPDIFRVQNGKIIFDLTTIDLILTP